MGSTGLPARIDSTGDPARIGGNDVSGRLSSTDGSTRIGSTGASTRIGGAGASVRLDGPGGLRRARDAGRRWPVDADPVPVETPPPSASRGRGTQHTLVRRPAHRSHAITMAAWGAAATATSALTALFVRRAAALAGTIASGMRVDGAVELLVTALGAAVTLWLAASTAVGACCLLARSAGSAWRGGEELVRRAAPAVVRRALVAALGAGIGLGVAVPALAAGPTGGAGPAGGGWDDLGWVVTTGPAPLPAVESDRTGASRPPAAGRPADGSAAPRSSPPAAPHGTGSSSETATLGAPMPGGSAEPGAPTPSDRSAASGRPATADGPTTSSGPPAVARWPGTPGGSSPEWPSPDQEPNAQGSSSVAGGSMATHESIGTGESGEPHPAIGTERWEDDTRTPEKVIPSAGGVPAGGERDGTDGRNPSRPDVGDGDTGSAAQASTLPTDSRGSGGGSPAADSAGADMEDGPGASVVVAPGDSLWSIAAQHLPAAATDALTAAAWPRWYAVNRSVIGDDPDLLLPGQRLTVPGPTDEVAS